MRTSPLTTVAVVGASAFVRPSLTLRDHTVRFPGLSPADVIDRFRARLDLHPDVVAAGDDTIVARFEGKAGPMPYRTLEVVGLETDRVTFEHLRGPFIRCDEAFEVRAAGDGSDVTHVGSFTMRGGVVGWLLGRIWIRGLFERHVAAELTKMSTDMTA